MAGELRLAGPHVVEQAAAAGGPRDARQDQLQALEPSVERRVAEMLGNATSEATHLMI